MGGVEPEHDVATSVSSIGEVHTLASEAHVSLRSASTGTELEFLAVLQHARCRSRIYRQKRVPEIDETYVGDENVAGG